MPDGGQQVSDTVAGTAAAQSLAVHGQAEQGDLAAVIVWVVVSGEWPVVIAAR
ncbi:hypothetical protein ACFQ0B_78075 [Nonomuraea thailandensis]